MQPKHIPAWLNATYQGLVSQLASFLDSKLCRDYQAEQAHFRYPHVIAQQLFNKGYTDAEFLSKVDWQRKLKKLPRKTAKPIIILGENQEKLELYHASQLITPLSKLYSDLIGRLPQDGLPFNQLASALTELSDVTVITTQAPYMGIAQDYTLSHDSLTIRAGLSEKQHLLALIRGIAYQKDERPYLAETLTYLICAFVGIDSSPFSVGYLAQTLAFSSAQLTNASTQSMVMRTADALLSELEVHLGLNNQPHDATVAEPATSQELPPQVIEPVANTRWNKFANLSEEEVNELAKTKSHTLVETSPTSQPRYINEETPSLASHEVQIMGIVNDSLVIAEDEQLPDPQDPLSWVDEVMTHGLGKALFVLKDFPYFQETDLADRYFTDKRAIYNRLNRFMLTHCLCNLQAAILHYRVKKTNPTGETVYSYKLKELVIALRKTYGDDLIEQVLLSEYRPIHKSEKLIIALQKHFLQACEATTAKQCDPMTDGEDLHDRFKRASRIRQYLLSAKPQAGQAIQSQTPVQAMENWAIKELRGLINAYTAFVKQKKPENIPPSTDGGFIMGKASPLKGTR